MTDSLLGLTNSAAAIVVVFGLCLLCHELGHFLLAKLFDMEVEEFAFGFGRALWRYRRGETTYRLNVFPYGAYVKIAGMEPGGPPVARGFHSRPRWQGAAVLVGGSLANLLLATALFTGVTLWVGEPDPADNAIYVAKVMARTPASDAGLESGDRLDGVDGQTQSLGVADVTQGSIAAKAGIAKGDQLERAGGQDVFVPSELLQALRSSRGGTAQVAVVDYRVEDIKKQQRIVALAIPSGLRAATAAEAAQTLEENLGLRFEQLTQSALVGYISSHIAQPVRLLVTRQGREMEVTATTVTVNGRYAMRDDTGMVYSRIRPMGRIGVVLRMATRRVGPVVAAKMGLLKSVSGAATVVLSVRAMLQRQVEAELAGPVAIMAISAERARIGWDAVLNWGGFISSMLAMVNLFPVPPFDGFRLVLLGFEAAIGRRIDAQKELILSIAGFVVIVFLFVALTLKDVGNLVRYGTP